LKRQSTCSKPASRSQASWSSTVARRSRQRAGPLRVVRAGLPGAAFVPGGVARLERRRRAEDLLRVDEDATGAQRVPDAGEEVALAGVVEVVDRQR
jgi:hypothetical protein